MTALLEYLDLTALLGYIDLLNSIQEALRGASWGPFQAGARGKMPQLPPPVGGPAVQPNTTLGKTWWPFFFLTTREKPKKSTTPMYA